MDSKNLSAVLDLLNSSEGKYIIIENGKPVFVLMSFGEYKKIVGREKQEIKNFKEELTEKINRDIALWHATQEENERDMALPFPRKEDPSYFYETKDEFEEFG
jgi:PHD/YefM family antitoxin component YafN of YafNO toxin-antitoxin module